jgi:chemotaxis protein histidine kinase CheA
MSSGLIDFFLLEASEYVQRLDGALASAGAAAPDGDALHGAARGLRGAATMAKFGAIADVAGGLERVARGLKDGRLAWDAGVRGTVVAAVDDLKIALHQARQWSPADDARSAVRAAELAALAPQQPRRSLATPGSIGSSLVFLASEAQEIAAALDAFALRPEQPPFLLNALPRVRALRGMASLRDLPPLQEVIDAVEVAAKPIELAEGVAPTDVAGFFAAAAAVLRRAAQDIRARGAPDPTAPEVRAFSAAAEALADVGVAAERIVPVREIFHDDPGPHVVQAALQPPTTLPQRFRIEVVSQAEHLRRLVADGRAAGDPATRTRLTRELRAALRALRTTADSFEEREVAQFAAATHDRAAALEVFALDALDEAAALLADPRTEPGHLQKRLAALAAGRSMDASIGAAFTTDTSTRPAEITPTDPSLGALFGRGPTPIAGQPLVPIESLAPTPAPAPAVPAAGAPPGALSGAGLTAALGQGIAGITRLDRSPLSPPAAIDGVDPDVIPIDELLLRGPAALARARELAAALHAGSLDPAPAVLAELDDLLALAGAE